MLQKQRNLKKNYDEEIIKSLEKIVKFMKILWYQKVSVMCGLKTLSLKNSRFLTLNAVKLTLLVFFLFSVQNFPCGIIMSIMQSLT